MCWPASFSASGAGDSWAGKLPGEPVGVAGLRSCEGWQSFRPTPVELVAHVVEPGRERCADQWGAGEGTAEGAS